MITLDRLNELLCKATNIELQQLIASINHIGVLWNSSFKITVNSIPELVRRKGLWITYILENGEIMTQEYIGSNDSVNDITIWGDENNWRSIAASSGLAKPEATTFTLTSSELAKVELTTSGPDTNKKFSFAFYIPKGDDGPSGVSGSDGDSIVFDWDDTKLRVGTKKADGSVIWGPYVQLKGNDGETPLPVDYQIMRFKQSTTQPVTPTGTSQNPSGWVNTPTSTGIWWMSIGQVSGNSNLVTSWSVPIKVTGLDGNDGTDGNDGSDGSNGVFAEFRYANNTTPNTAPTINKSDRNPSGWNTQPTILNTDEFMWMTFAYIDTNNNLVIQWSDPVRISGEKGPIGDPGPAGQDGLNGKKGQLVYTAGIYDPAITYTTDEYSAPVVLDTSDPSSAGGRMYVLNRQMSWVGNSQPYTTPYLDFQANGTDASWIAFSMYEAIYTKVLIAENGTVGSMVFNGDYIFSQTGTNTAGTEVTTYQNFDHNNPRTGAFRPYWFVNLKTGDSNAVKGTIGGYTIDNEGLISTEGNVVLRQRHIGAGVPNCRGVIGNNTVGPFFPNAFEAISAVNTLTAGASQKPTGWNSTSVNIGIYAWGSANHGGKAYDGMFVVEGILASKISKIDLGIQFTGETLIDLSKGDMIRLGAGSGAIYTLPTTFAQIRSQFGNFYNVTTGRYPIGTGGISLTLYNINNITCYLSSASVDNLTSNLTIGPYKQVHLIGSVSDSPEGITWYKVDNV